MFPCYSLIVMLTMLSKLYLFRKQTFLPFSAFMYAVGFSCQEHNTQILIKLHFLKLITNSTLKYTYK